MIQVHPIGYFDHITSNLVVDNLYFTPGYEELIYDGNSPIINARLLTLKLVRSSTSSKAMLPT